MGEGSELSLLELELCSPSGEAATWASLAGELDTIVEAVEQQRPGSQVERQGAGAGESGAGGGTTRLTGTSSPAS